MAEGDLSPEEFEQRMRAAAGRSGAAAAGTAANEAPITAAPAEAAATATSGAPSPVLPMTQVEAANLGASGSQRNAPPAIGDTRRRQEALGEEPGVPFHEEGLSTWTDLMAKARGNKEDQLRYLAGKFGKENVRLNEFKEPVVRVKNPSTGQPEDYPLHPHQLTMNSLTGLAASAPEIAGAIAGVALAGETGMTAAYPTLMRSLYGSLGAEAAGALKDVVLQSVDRPLGDVEVKRAVLEHAAAVPVDMAVDAAGAGLFKSAQLAKGLAAGKGIPNPFAGTPLMKPARPQLTSEGVAAASRLEKLTGVNQELRASESTGIPLMAMLEKYIERNPAGAQPQIAAGEKREAAAKATQNWLIDPSTLATDEEVGRKGLAALKRTVEPVEKDVALAEAGVAGAKAGMAKTEAAARPAAEKAVADKLYAEDARKIAAGFHVADIPDKPVPLADAGGVLKEGYLAERDAFKAEAARRYDALNANPKASAPIVGGGTLKQSIDAMRADLPKVVKGGATVPIDTPIRSRLDELSAKLDGGKVSINDLKQIRTDLDTAIKTGEAIPGVKEGRLKATYAAVTDAINKGLAEIGDPALSKAWKDATTYYRQNVGRFTEANVAALAREAEQPGAGNADFMKRLIGSEDAYTAARSFFGLQSAEMGTFRGTVRNKVLADSLSTGGLLDGANLASQLASLRKTNPVLYRDVFAGQGDAFMRAAEAMRGRQMKLPVEDVEKLLAPGQSAWNLGGKLVELQRSQARLNQEYQNGVVAKFLKGDAKAAELEPDKFIASLPQAKLSDVREVMARLEREDPAIAEQVRRKSAQGLLSDARRAATEPDTLAKLNGEPGDLINGAGLEAAMGHGDQLEKYKVLLGSLYAPLKDVAKVALLSDARESAARGVGMLAPGSAMHMFVKALTPWEGKDKANGIFKELGGLARDKVLSIALASDSLKQWLVKPYGLEDASQAIKLMIMSEPFLHAMHEEFRDNAEYAHAMSILKVGFGTAGRAGPAAAGNAASQPGNGSLAPDEFERRMNAARQR